ncbi:MAG TPA: flagellar basal body rod protein FlgB [Gaiellaceae bacterium]|jgi:flagellar basal-body rod protein FlgB
MGLFDLTDLVVQRGLEGASLRQQVLANNLANANTAGFKRSDVDFQSSLSAALDSGDPAQSLDALTFQPQADTSTTMTADGNNVDTDTEMAGLTQNAVEYEALAAVEQQRFAMLKSAMGA